MTGPRYSAYGETTDVFSSFSLGGIHSQGIVLVIPLEFQIKHQPFPMILYGSRRKAPFSGAPMRCVLEGSLLCENMADNEKLKGIGEGNAAEGKGVFLLGEKAHYSAPIQALSSIWKAR